MKKINSNDKLFEKYEKAGKSLIFQINNVSLVEVLEEGGYQNCNIEDTFFLDEDYIVEEDIYRRKVTVVASKKGTNKLDLCKVMKDALNIEIKGNKDKAWILDCDKDVCHKVYNQLHIALGYARRLENPIEVSIPQDYEC